MRKKCFDMKIIIDEDICAKHDLHPTEVLLMLALKLCHNVPQYLEHMVKKDLLYKKGDSYYYPMEDSDVKVIEIITESSANVPQQDDIVELANKMKELFPTGYKSANTTWRCSTRELVLALKKFFMLYGKYSNDEILDATKRYVDHFKNDNTYMRTLKYFVIKHERKEQFDENGEMICKLEEISELAKMLENKDDEQNNDADLLFANLV